MLPRYVLGVLLLAAFTAVYIPLYSNHDVFGYDEADYMYAQSRGFLANYMDEPSLPIHTFIESGFAKGTSKQKRTELSELIRSSGDVPFYRHYHGPLYFYWLRLAGVLGCTDESDFRTASLLLFALTGVVLLLATSSLIGDSWVGVFLPLILLLGCKTNILSATTLTPHPMYAVTSLATLWMLSRYLRSHERKDWYFSLVLLAMAFLSIEYAVLLAATFVLSLFTLRKSFPVIQRPMLGFVARSVGILVLVIAICWLGGIVKFTIIKNYLFFTYFTIVRGSEYGGSALSAWRDRFVMEPILWSIAVISLVYAFTRLRDKRHLLPFVIYPILLVITQYLDVTDLHFILFSAGILACRRHSFRTYSQNSSGALSSRGVNDDCSFHALSWRCTSPPRTRERDTESGRRFLSEDSARGG